MMKWVQTAVRTCEGEEGGIHVTSKEGWDVNLVNGDSSWKNKANGGGVLFPSLN